MSLSSIDMDPIPERIVATNDAAIQQNSQTASQYINEQLALEADAKEILPYKFDKCTYEIGPLRQSVFACLTCSPPPASAAQVYTPAGICYACSISCHGEHTLVELFKRRNFVCDCGTTRMPDTSPCMLRSDATTGRKGATKQDAAKANTYNHNFENKFCGCGEEYDPDQEKGTMYQCIGLGSVATGGCGEDWWHPECLMGLPRDWFQKGLAKPRVEKKVEHDQNDEPESPREPEHPVPEGFPDDNDFSGLICYKCVDSNPWIKTYAGTVGFLPPIHRIEPQSGAGGQELNEIPSLKRKATADNELERSASPAKRVREENVEPSAQLDADPNVQPKAERTGSTVASHPLNFTEPDAKHKHDTLPPPPEGSFSILAKEDFRDHFCHCPQCFPNLIPHPQLQEEEDDYEPSISDSQASVVEGGTATRSAGTGSILERGEAALSNMDRVKAIEGVMVYNHLRDKVKEFLKPYAESGQAVSAEDIKGYFERLRGDQDAMKEARQKPVAGDGDGDNRREQSGY